MALDSYTGLLDELKTWLWDREDIVPRLPGFVVMCEAALNRRLRHWRGQKRVTAAFSGSRYPVPSDWLEADSVRINGGRPLILTSQENLAGIGVARPDSTAPTHFDVVAGEVEVIPAPTPDAQSQIDLIYFAKVPALVANSTNWVLQNAPDIYLYGSLMHSAPYGSEDERLATWVGAFDRLVEELNEEHRKSRRSGGPLQRQLRTFG